MSAPFEKFTVLTTVRSDSDKSFGYIVTVPKTPTCDYDACAEFIERAISNALSYQRDSDYRKELERQRRAGEK